MPFSFFRIPSFVRLGYSSAHRDHHPQRRAILTLVKTVLILHVFTEYGYNIEPTAGPSMLPSAQVTGDWYIISKLYRRGRGIQVGDVVTYESTVEPGVKVTKRVVGLQGDYVMRYSPDSGNDGMIQVPQGHCWVVGDNMDASRDSRLFGPVPLALIKGKHIAKIFPWRERRWLGNPLRHLSED